MPEKYPGLSRRGFLQFGGVALLCLLTGCRGSSQEKTPLIASLSKDKHAPENKTTTASKHYSTPTNNNYLPEIQKARTTQAPEFVIPTSYQEIDSLAGTKLFYSEKGVYLCIFDLKSLKPDIITGGWATFDQFWPKESLVSAFAGTHYREGILEFPFKDNGQVSQAALKQNGNEFMRMIEFYEQSAILSVYQNDRFISSNAPTIITAENIYAPREFKRLRARTILTTNPDGNLLVIIFKSADRILVEEKLNELNIDPNMALNIGGGSQAALMFNNKEYVSSNKSVTHIIGIRRN